LIVWQANAVPLLRQSIGVAVKIWYNIPMLVKLNTFSLLGIDAVPVDVTVLMWGRLRRHRVAEKWSQESGGRRQK